MKLEVIDKAKDRSSAVGVKIIRRFSNGLVRGRFWTDSRIAGHASPADISRVNAAMRCAESSASLETQFGDEGRAIKRAALNPRVVGRRPAHENNGIKVK
jgi:hypothetical protein